MDKFDETIKNARETHEPSEHFVEGTMKEVMDRQPDQKKTRGIRFWAPIAAGAVVVVALVFVLLPSGKTAIPTGNKTNVATTGTSSGQPESSTVPAGTSNATLANDLSNVQGAMNQEGTDQNGANSALNDSQQEITVPTN